LDTYGKVRYYQNVSGGANPTFAQPVLIDERKYTLVPTTPIGTATAGPMFW